MKEIKIQTWNLGLLEILGAEIVPFVKERFPLILQKIQKIEVDIFCFQEVFDKEHFQELSKILVKFPYKFRAKAWNLFKSPGLCVFSKFPILEHSFERFESQQDIERFSNHGFQKIKVDISGKIINIFNLHLTAGGLTGNLETKRSARVAEKQLSQIFKNLKKDEENILIGDFNCGPLTDNETYDFLHKNGFRDILKNFEVEKNLTWDNQNALVARQKYDMPSDRIDHLFLDVNSNLKFIGHEVNLKDTYNEAPFNLSDHFGIRFSLGI